MLYVFLSLAYGIGWILAELISTSRRLVPQPNQRAELPENKRLLLNSTTSANRARRTRNGPEQQQVRKHPFDSQQIAFSYQLGRRLPVINHVQLSKVKTKI
ncbi:hypothetical protein AAFF_G00351970 [Aldrovandia affinis]|uniref:Uncharacterized protein n=1 Tax=Aldrovandia affinis TaxID=143900 RepID=A0AAD7WNQ5_9TELE|nr:hypothetical protein AAFF_G00351970 [Aldrovandia affinis]